MRVGDDPTGISDFEGGLAVVIGPGGRQIDECDAFDHVYEHLHRSRF